MKKTFLFTAILLAFAFLTKANNEFQPVANAQNVVVAGHARFTVLTPSLIRLEWSLGNHFENRASLTFINRKLPDIKFSVSKSASGITIQTKELILRYRNDGRPFCPENLSVSFLLNGKKRVWTPGMKDAENLKGTTRTVDGRQEIKPADLEDGILSRSGWALIDDSRQNLFDGGNPEWVVSRYDSTSLDWYFFGYGHRYKEALADFTRVAGKIPMPPKFTFGYWYSRYFCYSDSEIKDLVTDMERYDVPVDVFIVDMDWHNTYGINSKTGNFIGWTGYSWNKNLFPQPSEFLDWMHHRQLKVSLNLHPADGIYQKEECFAGFARAFNKDTLGVERFAYNMEDKKWSEAYFGSVIRPLEKQGVDFWWLDWQQWPLSKTVKGLSNTWWLNHTFFADMETHSDKRPLLFHRWGGLGNHRYQIGFSGDSHSTFRMLASLPYYTATASNVGYGYWSHDIGGHIQEYAQTNPELYLRWIQFGVFSPMLRTHSSKQGNIERRIWKFPNFTEMNEALHLRYTLAPYIYTASREAYDKGVSICRPMYYDFPENDTSYRVPQQYMFGNDILVAPIAQAADSNGLAKQTLWLPDGKWYDMSHGILLNGNRMISQQFASNEIPWYARSGAIIPENPRINTLQKDPQHVVFCLIPGEMGEYTLYEDAGDSKGYQSGEYALTVITQIRKENHISVTVSPRKGNYPGMAIERKYTFRLLGSLPPATVRVNGEQIHFSNENDGIGYRYDASNTELIVSLPLTNCNLSVSLEIETHTNNDAAITNGLKGSFNRMKRASFEIKSSISENDWARSPSDLFSRLSQVPTAVDYRPEQAEEQFLFYQNHLDSAIGELKSAFGFSASKVEKYKALLEMQSK